MIFILTTVLYLTKHGNLQASLMFWYLLFCSKQSKQRFYSKYSWYWRSDRAWTKAQVNSSVILFALRVCTKSLKSDMTCSSHKIKWVPSVSNHSLVPHLDNRTSEKGRHCHGFFEFSLMVIWVSILNIWIQVLSKIVLLYLKWLVWLMVPRYS